MRLFVMIPRGYSLPYYLCILEAAINFFDLLLLGVGFITIYKLRLNFHSKICIFFLATQVIPFILGRAVILGYQLKLYLHGVDPEKSLLLVICSWWRGYYLFLALAGSTCAAAERHISLYYIEDYERVRHLWVPTVLIVMWASISAFEATAYLFEWISLILAVIIIGFVNFIGMFVYYNVQRKTAKLNKALKHRIPCKLRYSLSVRYQLEENVWISKTMKNTAILVFGTNIFTSIFFLGYNLPYFHFDEKVRQVFDCCFNLLVAINGVVFAFGLYFRNSYMVGLVKKFFVPKDANRNDIENEGDFYFGQLAEQWLVNYDSN